MHSVLQNKVINHTIVMKTKTILQSLLIVLLATLMACGGNNSENNDNASDINAPTGNPDIDGLTREIAQNPQDPALYATRGELFYEKEGYDEAISDLTRAIEMDSTRPEYYHLLADAHLDYFRSRPALKIMENAAERFPSNIPTLLKLSEYQLILKQYEESMRTIDKILRQDPQNAEAYFMFGMNFEEQGDTVRAINSYQKAVEFDAEIIEGWINLGQLYGERGSPLAGQYFENAVSIDPQNIIALHAQADYFSSQGQLQEAVDTYRKIVSIDPQYDPAHFNSGLIYLDMDSVARAEKMFDITLEVSPRHIRAYYYRGVAREMQGNNDAALRDYEQALDMAPDYQQALEGVERLKSAG